MKQSLILMFCIMLVSVAANAQENTKPAAELTGAYGFLRTNSINVPAGWDASVNIPANNWFGVVGDLWGATKSDAGLTTTIYAGGAGPQFTVRTPKIAPYFRLVFGAGHGTTSGSIFGFNISGATTAFVMSPGGGADFRINDQLWFRLGANYPIERKYGVALDGLQAIVGITYRFGGGRQRVKVGQVNPTEVPGGNSVAPLLGVVVDNNMRVIRFLSHSVLERHGVEVGDVINSVDDKQVKTAQEFSSAVAALTKGITVKIGFLSRGYWQTWTSVQL